MDAFERVRELAAQQHSQAVAVGVDPWTPMALINAAVAGLDLEIAWLPPDDPALRGARALFDHQSGTICAADDGTPTEKALLAAHEIGHACLHQSSTCAAEDVDASRSMEAAPVGLQRVEDYGARERRELQANVFAREFLLPRSRARNLHLTDGLGADAIAGRSGLPKDLVRQQLLDALLLPAVGAIEAASSSLSFHEDRSQDIAAGHRGSAFQLQAGPGTGKTRTLVKRVVSLIEDDVDPASILCLTFSNRAAGELAERIGTVVPHVSQQIWVGTFHAFGLDLLRRHHDALNLPADPILFDRSDAIGLLEEILPTLPLRHYRNLWDPTLILREIVGAISRAKDELVDAAGYRDLAERMRSAAGTEEEIVAAEKCLEVAIVYELYERTLKERGAVDFGDLVMLPALLLEREEQVRALVQLRHRHVLVDEYQDVNRASARLLRALAGNGERLWVVGDSRQSIYRFRGASSANMRLFAEDYPGAQVDQLRINYRSTEEIVSTFVAIASHMSASADMLRLDLKAARGSAGQHPEIRVFEQLEDEAEGIAAAVRELEAAGVRLRDQAVLCRTNGRLNAIAEALEERGIPVLHLGSLFERDEIRDMLALLSLVTAPLGTGLVRVAAMPRYEISLQDVNLACRHMRETEGAPLAKLAACVEIPGLTSPGREGLRRLVDDLTGFSFGSSPWDLLTTYLLDRTRMVADLAGKASVADRMRAVALWQFLNFTRETSGGYGPLVPRLLDRVRRLVLLAEERDLRQVPASALGMDAVRLMTVHGSKGLEFEAVHLPGLATRSIPSSYRGQRCPPPAGMVAGAENATPKEEDRRAHGEEEECLFFVAVSRARTHLRLYRPSRQRNGQNRSPSRFIEWLPAGTRTVMRPPVLPLPAGVQRPGPIAVSVPEGWSITDTRLVAYRKCPRRFFYTHLLGLGGARQPTAFSRTHDCIHDIIRWVRAEREAGRHPNIEAAEEQFSRIWGERGPADHAFADDYRRLAGRLVETLVTAGSGRNFKAATPLVLDLSTGLVAVEPDEVAELPNGSVVVRRVRTGRKREDEYDELEYALYHEAGRQQFGGLFRLEALHLGDELAEPVEISPTKIKNRLEICRTILADIAAGKFPVDEDAVSCPRCPHFFICAATPHGPLTIT